MPILEDASANKGIKGEDVVCVMDRLLFQRGTTPVRIRVDNPLRQRGEWPGVHLPGTRSMGLPAWCDAELQPHRQAYR